jgi:hypothetical protein
MKSKKNQDHWEVWLTAEETMAWKLRHGILNSPFAGYPIYAKFNSENELIYAHKTVEGKILELSIWVDVSGIAWCVQDAMGESYDNSPW